MAVRERIDIFLALAGRTVFETSGIPDKPAGRIKIGPHSHRVAIFRMPPSARRRVGRNWDDRGEYRPLRGATSIGVGSNNGILGRQRREHRVIGHRVF
jgi:hypothetical protein